jgi:sialate O-acetylesterase
MKIPPSLIPALFAALASNIAPAAVRLPALISDHMVLQQEAKSSVWGWANAGEKITVEFAGQKAETQADPDGRWYVRLNDLKAGTAGDMTIKGENEVVIKDVLVGEVWVCSGQSNMAWIVEKSGQPEVEIPAANFPKIRMFTVVRNASIQPQEDCAGKWAVCSPETVAEFSAVAYFFGRELHRKLDRPIGLITTAWGGTPAEFWLPEDVLKATPGSGQYFERWETEKRNYPAAKEAYDKAHTAWKEKAAQLRAEGKPVPQAPRAPRGGDDFGAPGCLWNGMIVPVLPYTIQGAIWYQGESNATAMSAEYYRVLFPTMIMSWRQGWARAGLAGSDHPEFPFLYVQLANFKERLPDPVDSWWALLRESQLMTLDLPRTGMAVAIDIGEADDIHPKNKQEVGRRLALAAFAQVYFLDTEYSGPIYTGAQEEEGRIRLSFRNADGLRAAEGDVFKGFAIAGEDRKFVWADVRIDADHVLVSSPQVPKPVAVRYGWADNPEVNLVNGAGLPASPFRSDSWPQEPPQGR